MRQNLGPWYLLTGLVLGVAVGLVYVWILNPAPYRDTDPHTLQAEYKDQYRILIATAFASTGDLVRARARLELIGDEDIYQSLFDLAQRASAGEAGPEEARALRILVAALAQPASLATSPPPAGP
jgi:uncharacterized membrane-anchored protein YhcB (DUF1043 family)